MSFSEDSETKQSESFDSGTYDSRIRSLLIDDDSRTYDSRTCDSRTIDSRTIDSDADAATYDSATVGTYDSRSHFDKKSPWIARCSDLFFEGVEDTFCCRINDKWEDELRDFEEDDDTLVTAPSLSNKVSMGEETDSKTADSYETFEDFKKKKVSWALCGGTIEEEKKEEESIDQDVLFGESIGDEESSGNPPWFSCGGTHNVCIVSDEEEKEGDDYEQELLKAELTREFAALKEEFKEKEPVPYVQELFSCGGEDKKKSMILEEVPEDEVLDGAESLLDAPPSVNSQKKTENNIKSYSYLAQYHSSKIKENEGAKEEEKEVSNEFVHGNHRGWGANTPPRTKKSNSSAPTTPRSTPRKKNGNEKKKNTSAPTTLEEYVATRDNKRSPPRKKKNDSRKKTSPQKKDVEKDGITLKVLKEQQDAISVNSKILEEYRNEMKKNKKVLDEYRNEMKNIEEQKILKDYQKVKKKIQREQILQQYREDLKKIDMEHMVPNDFPDDEEYPDDEGYSNTSEHEVFPRARSMSSNTHASDEQSRNDSTKCGSSSTPTRDLPSVGSSQKSSGKKTVKKMTKSYKYFSGLASHSTNRSITQSISNASLSSGSFDGSSYGSTYEKSSFTTPRKKLVNYQAKTPASITTADTTVTAGNLTAGNVPSMKSRNRAKKTEIEEYQHFRPHRSNRAELAKSKKLALGRNRAAAAKEQKFKKAFPYMINHSLFHENIENQQKNRSKASTGRSRR